MTALLASQHPVTWAAPRPLWSAAPSHAPQILRFASDDFMDRLIALLENDPARLGEYVAAYETWRAPLGTPADPLDHVPLPGPMKAARREKRLKQKPALPAETTARLKLFQPAHQRYYVAAASLACAIPGLPDRALAGGHEQVGFVLRRLLPVDSTPDGDLAEHAWVITPEGPRWQRVTTALDNSILAPGEERLPVFPLSHKLWAGLIPVARREAYMGAPVIRTPTTLTEGQHAALQPATVPPPRPSTLARSSEFRLDVLEPWKAVIRSAQVAAIDIAADTRDGSSPASRQARTREANLRLQMQSWLVLTDLKTFLQSHLEPVADAIVANNPAGLSGFRRQLYDFLSEPLTTASRNALRNGLRRFGSTADAAPHLASIADALRALTPVLAKHLDAATTYYPSAEAWPDFHFLLAGIGSDGNGAGTAATGPYVFAAGLAAAEPADTLAYPPASPADAAQNALERLATLVARCLTPEPETSARPLPYAQTVAQSVAETVGDTGLFCLRFVHLNNDCGPLHLPTLSEPSARFELASFFDPDAPARPLRISLPLDTSPAGLRKHARGTAFVLSDMLCGQVQRAKGLGLIDLIRQVLPWPLHKQIDIGDGGNCKNGNGVDIGMICSLSIPIITICALILLMIIVTLLDFIFRWMPWFIACFPVPRLKGKS